MPSPPRDFRYTFDFLNKGNLIYVYQNFNYLLSIGRLEDAKAFEEEYTEDIDTTTLFTKSQTMSGFPNCHN
jgi:hypothetical protein